MHRVIRDNLEQVLGKSHIEECGSQVASHLHECQECRGEVDAMLAHARLLQELRADAEPRPGFYARVMERIEKQTPASIWNILSESPFGQRIAVASLALALLAGVFLYTADRAPEQSAANPTLQFMPGEDQSAQVLTKSGLPDRDTVFVNLVTYREQ